MIAINIGFVTGVMFGFELYDDEEERSSSFILDLFILRIVFTSYKD